MTYLETIKSKIGAKKICMYPMGLLTQADAKKLWDHGICVDFFCDRNPELWGTELLVGDKSIPCISKQQLLKMDANELIVIGDSLYYPEIKQELQAEGIQNIFRVYTPKLSIDDFLKQQGDGLKSRIEAVLNICSDETSKNVFQRLTDSWNDPCCPDGYFECVYDRNQYFNPAIIKLQKDEVFVDAGAYTGDTIQRFIRFCGGNFEKIHAFELDPLIFARLTETVSQTGYENIICYPFGLFDQNKKIRFYAGDANSTVCGDDQTGTVGTVKRLDDVLNGQKVTFIKMDIEGSETAALRGASKIIREQKPKLAVCIYHSPEDMLTIPLYLKQLVPEYRIYIRHHTNTMYETVCYAVCD